MSQNRPDYSWANYLDYMEGGGSDVLAFRAATSPFKAAEEKKDLALWGVLAAVGVTIIAILLSELPFWPFTISGKHPIEPVMLAIVLGMVLSNVWTLPKSLQSGIKFSVKKILPVGIVLLGARLDFFIMQQVGLRGLCFSLIETIVALLLLAFLVRVLKLPGKLGTLLGVGTAICGGTAIVATAPVIEAPDEDVVVSVATVTLLGLIAMFLMPVIGNAMELSEKAFGVWAGLGIHQTPQVVAAGFAYGPEAGETATIVKLARVCLLAPVVFVIGVIYARQKAARGASSTQKRINYLHLFPMFVLGFLGMALLKTCGLIPDVTFHGGTRLLNPGEHRYSLASLAETVSKFCIIISMAGVGLETRFSAMKQTGLKPLGAAFFAIVVIAGLILLLIRTIGV
jgi:uncharacterized integral membrane protein (TIGR00698 family)